MPLSKELIETGIDQYGHSAICCAHCHTPAERTETTNEHGGIVELALRCPRCTTIFGTWAIEQQRASDIGSYLNRIGRRSA
jgi:hypothetical protein